MMLQSRYDPVFHVKMYVDQYKNKFIPTSADDLQPSNLWPCAVLKRKPGRPKRRRLEKKQKALKFVPDPVLPAFQQGSDT